MELKEFAPGGYRYLTGITAYSSGVVAMPGYEIIHAVLLRPVPWRAGFDLVEKHLEQAGRPRQALCAVELRSPKPFSFDGFAAFNRSYSAVLKDWDIMIGDDNPVARTNVAPVVRPPASESLHAFSYTVPSGDEAPTFIVAGAGEVERQSLSSTRIVRANETGTDAMQEKAAHVMTVMADRLRGLGMGWADVTTVDIYTPHELRSYLEPTVLEPIGDAATKGVCWHLSYPPIEGLVYEMDMRGVRRELVV